MNPFYQIDNITIYHGDLREILPSLSNIDYVITDPPYGLGFMEQNWDRSVPGPEYWQTIRSACKPGAMLMAFGGTRTYHRLTCAIEDANWQIRDCLMWLYGQGFPKSLNISKTINKQAPNLAAQWAGWGTALKPAWEPILLAMNALDGTFAANAIQHGVAGLNIDASRIPTNEIISNHSRSSEAAISKGKYGNSCSQETHQTRGQQLGRFPTNLILDEDSATQLDEQSGTLTSGTNCIRTKPGVGYHGNMGQAGDIQTSYGDSGGASRFFYCSKASKKERGTNNDHPTVKPVALMEYLLTLCSTPTGGLILDPFAGSGTTALAAKKLGRPCICVELEEHNCEIIANRLSDV